MQIVFDNVTEITEQHVDRLLVETEKFINELPDQSIRDVSDVTVLCLERGPCLTNGDAWFRFVPRASKGGTVKAAWVATGNGITKLGTPGVCEIAQINMAWKKCVSDRSRERLQRAFIAMRAIDAKPIKQLVSSFMGKPLEPEFDAVVNIPPPGKMTGSQGAKAAVHDPLSIERPRFDVSGDLSQAQLDLISPDSDGVRVKRVTPNGAISYLYRRPVFVHGQCTITHHATRLPGSIVTFHCVVMDGPAGRFLLRADRLELPRLNFLWEVFRSESEAMKATTTEQ